MINLLNFLIPIIQILMSVLAMEVVAVRRVRTLLVRLPVPVWMGSSLEETD